MDSILEARDVSFAYGPGKWAIQGMSFVLTAPRRVALLGANGVGKSTLMLLLNGTLRPHAGELIVLGKPMDYSRSGLQWLHQGRIDGIIIYGTAMDLGWPSVDWAREWIQKVGEEKL